MEAVKGQLAFLLIDLREFDSLLSLCDGDAASTNLRPLYEVLKARIEGVQESLVLANVVLQPVFIRDNSTSSDSSSMKIKPITLATFGGDIKEWSA